MKCEVRGVGNRQPQLVRYSLSLDEQLIVVEHVPAEVCSHCGETSFRPDVVETLQKTVWERRQPTRMIETPIYEFAA